MTTVILAIDRDNDIGEKTGIKGPIIGVEDNIKAAEKLLLKDPEDSDGNAVFAAVRLAKERGCEVVTVTGDKEVGIKSDEVVKEQLDKVVEGLDVEKVVLVSDGAEDEYIIPIVQSKLDILSVKRVVVRQSEQLEGAYYLLKKFLTDISEDPRLAKVVLGLPAIALILLALFGAAGWRIVLGAIGLYLIVKGFKLEGVLEGILDEFQLSLEKGRISFFIYVLAVVFGIVGIAFGYQGIENAGPSDLITTFSVFIFSSIYVFFIAGFLLWMGKVIMAYTQRKLGVRHLTVLALFFSVVVVARSATEMILEPEIGFARLVISIVIGFVVLSTSLAVERFSK